MTKWKIAFPYYGGKFSKLSWLLPFIPSTKVFVEPFGGSMAVLLNRDPPSEIEIYNDIDHDVVNFFRTLRDNNEILLPKISFTPYSRKEFDICTSFLECPLESKEKQPVEWARCFFVIVRQGMFGSQHVKTWARPTFIVRQGMSQYTSRWLGGVDRLPEIVERISSVIMECGDAIKTIERYDSTETTHYCDLPYPHESRSSEKIYGEHEVDTDYHIALSESLHNCKGNVALSSYRSSLYDELYNDWNRVEGPLQTLRGTKDSTRQEILLTNYDPDLESKKVKSSKKASGVFA